MLGDSESRSTSKEESTRHSRADRHSHFCLGEGPASMGRGGICGQGWHLWAGVASAGRPGICGQGWCASLSASPGHRAACSVPLGVHALVLAHLFWGTSSP